MNLFINSKIIGLRPSYILLVNASNTTDALFHSNSFSLNRSLFVASSLRDGIEKFKTERTKFVFIDERLLLSDPAMSDQFLQLLKSDSDSIVTVLEEAGNSRLKKDILSMGFGYAERPFSVSQMMSLCSLR